MVVLERAYRRLVLTHQAPQQHQSRAYRGTSHPPRTLQLDFAEGPMVVLVGWWFLMSEVPL